MSHALPKQSADDARQIKALTDAVAEELRRHATPGLDPAGMAWIEQRPQSLWPLLDAAVAASTAGTPLTLKVASFTARRDGQEY